MKKFLSFLFTMFLFVATFGIVSGCSHDATIDTVYLVHNGKRYTNNSTINYTIDNDINFNKSNIGFIALFTDNLERVVNPSHTKYYYYAIDETIEDKFEITDVETHLPFYNSTCKALYTGYYIFEYLIDGDKFEFTIFVDKENFIDDLKVEFIKNGQALQNATWTYGDNKDNIQDNNISLKINYSTDLKPSYYLLTKEQYLEANGNTALFNGSTFDINSLDAGEYYIYAKIDATNRYVGGTTNASKCVITQRQLNINNVIIRNINYYYNGHQGDLTVEEIRDNIILNNIGYAYLVDNHGIQSQISGYFEITNPNNHVIEYTYDKTTATAKDAISLEYKFYNPNDQKNYTFGDLTFTTDVIVHKGTFSCDFTIDISVEENTEAEVKRVVLATYAYLNNNLVTYTVNTQEKYVEFSLVDTANYVWEDASFNCSTQNVKLYYTVNE